ncbi:MAG: CRP-like cAMP-binding protein [Arenicella sp.]|jgi:CRP-like cAMP-binding protein
MNEDIIQLIQNAFKPIDFTQDDYSCFYNMWTACEFEKGEIITDIDQIERNFYIVIRGVQVVYVIDKNGTEKVIGFSFDHSFSGIYDSYIHSKPSKYILKSLTPSKMIKLSKSNYDSLFDTYPAFDRWGRIAHQELLIGRVNREIELITLSANERFEQFMSRCPKPLLGIPQKYLASYLNMTAETFSRMRKS